jgi:hypothetical protein
MENRMDFYACRSFTNDKNFWVKMMSVKIRNWIGIGMVSAAFLVSGSGAAASDFYVSQNGAGITNSLAWLDTPAHWNNGAGTIQAGDKIHLCGTLTNTLTIGGSGTSGNPITILFEPNAKFSAPTISTPNSGWICLADHIIIDGGVNGRIELTDNGTPAAYGGTFDYNNGSVWGIYGNTHNDVTIKNLTIAGMYVRQTATDPGPINDENDVGGIFTRDSSNLTISNCVISDTHIAVNLTYNVNYQSNVVFTHCFLTNYAWGFSMAADTDNAKLDNLFITNNTFCTGDAWECSPAVQYFHRNSIYLRLDLVSGGRMSNVVIACNYVKAGTNPKTAVGGTGGIGGSYDTYTNVQHQMVYNNILVLTYPLTYSGGGGPQIGAGGIDCLLANNTIIGWRTNSGYGGSGFSIGGSNCVAFNNIVVAGSAELLGTTANVTGLTDDYPTTSHLFDTNNVKSDFNIFNGQANNSWVTLIYSTNYSGGYQQLAWEHLFDSLSAWRGNFKNQEVHSTTATVQLGANFAPLSTDTVAVGHGTNLTAYAIANNLPGLTNDFAGNPRPATGNWTIGAYQSPAPLVSLVASPTSVTNGQSSTLTWSSVNATNLTLSGFGLVAPNGSTNVLPTQITMYITTYIAKAIGTNGTFLASVSVTNLPSPPLMLRVIGYNSQ